MLRSLRTGFIAATLLFGAAAVLAKPADFVGTREAGYKSLGAAFKTVNDRLRSGDVRGPEFMGAVARIQTVSREQYKWFPAGSGRSSGLKTAARPEIWGNAPQFRAAQDAFARQADAFAKAAATSDAGLIRGEARKLGATCKGCHDNFREEDN
ncbi:cytochrome c [Novosphingobium sp. ST904]|uniref:c-type cytochrome n=1 Tax=Novosphingobium sp. ST904 TaxID=1684385 RepID=UPI0006CE2755|nr:cytochrome c [Novosphingobium sp. ST904]KPH68115.1 hypothetical protein ADT71_01670 [Novosphingobium sp. ST904]TCM23704.1 cytochrome c556 [Novosphingobium sp. ST904]